MLCIQCNQFMSITYKFRPQVINWTRRYNIQKSQVMFVTLLNTLYLSYDWWHAKIAYECNVTIGVKFPCGDFDPRIIIEISAFLFGRLMLKPLVSITHAVDRGPVQCSDGARKCRFGCGTLMRRRRPAWKLSSMLFVPSVMHPSSQNQLMHAILLAPISMSTGVVG